MADQKGAEILGASITLLRKICEVADIVDEKAARRPQDAIGISAKQRASCLACPHNPSRTFPALNAILLEDVGNFHAAFKHDVAARMAFNPPNQTCLGCVSQTVSDLEHLYLVFEKSVRDIIKAGGKNVVTGDDAASEEE
jgi:hypothetical protein